jgi:hypothetical protein
VEGTASELCPMKGFGISGVEPSASATRELLSYLVSCLVGRLFS